MNGNGWSYIPANQYDEIEEFKEKYKPIDNPVAKNKWGIKDDFFESYGQDYEFVALQPDDVVWTWCTSDGDGWDYVHQGWHSANCMGYYIASVPYQEGMPNQYAWRIEGEIEFHDGEYAGETLTTDGDYLDEDRTAELVKIGTKQGLDAMVQYIKDNELQWCIYQ